MKIDAIIALIGSLVPVVNNLVGFINRTIENLKQAKEMTPEQEAVLDATVDQIDRPPWWQSDAK